MRHLIASATNRFRSGFSNRPAVNALVAVLLVAAAVRALGFSSPPRIYNDTNSYVWLAHRIRTLHLRGYSNGRTPGYPLFLVLAGSNFYVACFIQSLLGGAIAAMLFAMVYRRSRSVAFALGLGIAYGVDLSQIRFEQSILTEAWCTFLLTLSVFVFQRMAAQRESPLPEKSSWREHAILGTLTGLTGLTRPLYVYLAPLYFVLLAMMRPRVPIRLAERATRLAAFAIPAGALLLGWCLVNWLNTGYFGITTSIRFDLDRAAAIQPADRLAAEPSGKASRLPLNQLARQPAFFARQVRKAWIRFWTPPFYTGRPYLGGPVTAPVLGEPLPKPLPNAEPQGLWAVAYWPLRVANLIFLASAAWSIVRLVRRIRPIDFDLCMIAIVLAASAGQAIIEFGGNDRYSAPTAPLVLYIVTISIWQLRSMLIAAKA